MASMLSLLLEDASMSLEEKETAIEELLGFNPGAVEDRLRDSRESVYAGLAQEALSTPFEDYYTVLCDLPPGQVLADLGAGYCKGSILSAAIGRKDACLSLELNPDRVDCARSTLAKLGFESDFVRQFDLLSDPLPNCDAYFVYLPLGDLVFKALEQLARRQARAVFYVVESHGDMLDFFYALPKWFAPVAFFPSRAARHRPGIHKFFFSCGAEESFEPNSIEVLYPLIRRWSQNEKVELDKEGEIVQAPVNSLLPIRYNGEMALECLEIKRIVDFKRVKIASL